MQYFGESWSQLTEELEKIPAPKGKCCWCNEEFVAEDQGLLIPQNSYYHKDCFLRSVLGSVGHQRKQCNCFGGSLEDPPELTAREAAIAAVNEFNKSTRVKSELLCDRKC